MKNFKLYVAAMALLSPMGGGHMQQLYKTALITYMMTPTKCSFQEEEAGAQSA